MYSYDQVVSGAIDLAQSLSVENRNPSLEPAHLLLGLINHPKSKSHKLLSGSKDSVSKLIQMFPTADAKGFKPDMLKASPAFGNWLSLASASSIQKGHNEITEADLWSDLPKFFPSLSLPENWQSVQSKDDGEELEKPDFLIDLNELASAGKLDPVIGRTREIRAVMEILGRRRKNNPVLVGEAGVGKTAVVEGLADMIVKGKAPEALKDKTILSLDLGALMAGTKFRGEFEERLQKMLKYITSQNGKVILFIDEIHQLVGAGKTEGAMDAANLLKPALARGDLHCIGATTYNEYRRYILADSALERRFRGVPIAEPSEEDAIEIMMGLKDKFEIHHGIEISDDAIFNSVFLSKQYITDKFLPDKAINLVDEAAAALKLSAEAMPPNLVELESEIRAKHIYARTEKSNPDLEKQIAALQVEFEKQKAIWDKDVQNLKRHSGVKNLLDKAKFDLEKAVQNSQYEEASRIKFSVIPELTRQISESGGAIRLEKKDIAQVISRQTGIPVEKILRTKQENILELEAALKKRVFGQDDCLKEIAETLMSSHAGLNDPNRPLGSFLLLGPTGVGKTETARGLAQFLFDSEDAMIRLDMSEYSEKHSCAKLIGSPAGYVGYEDGGVLTEALRRRPYSVILFDEIEKAHPDFSDILLQILDDGRLTDNKGRTANFRNAIVLLTSNSKDIKRDFKPELLGRLDAVLTYNSIDQSIMNQLVQKQISLANERLRSKSMTIKLSDLAIQDLAKRGFDPTYGARPLKTLFNKLVLRPLSREILKGGDVAAVWKGDLNQKGDLVFEHTRNPS